MQHGSLMCPSCVTHIYEEVECRIPGKAAIHRQQLGPVDAPGVLREVIDGLLVFLRAVLVSGTEDSVQVFATVWIHVDELPGIKAPAFNCHTFSRCIFRSSTSRIVQDVLCASTPSSMGKRGTPLMQTCIEAFLHAFCVTYQSAHVWGTSIVCHTASQPRINSVSFWIVGRFLV